MPPRNDEFTLFRPEVFMERIAGDADLAREMLGAFLEDAPERLAELRAAVQAADAHQVNRKAHALKGMVGVLRSQGVADLALEVEKAGEEGDLDKAAGILPGLARLLEQLREEVRAFLKTLPIHL